MQTREKYIIGSLFLVIFCGLFYLIKSALTPFICSLVVAYFLDPLVDYLTNKHKLARLTSTALILILFLSIFIGASAILLPIIYAQTAELIDALPKYLQVITQNF